MNRPVSPGFSPLIQEERFFQWGLNPSCDGPGSWCERGRGVPPMRPSTLPSERCPCGLHHGERQGTKSFQRLSLGSLSPSQERSDCHPYLAWRHLLDSGPQWPSGLGGTQLEDSRNYSFSCPEKNLESASDMDCTVEGLKKKHMRTLTSDVQQTETPVRDELCRGRGAAAFWTEAYCVTNEVS